MPDAAWSHWHPETQAGHAVELAVLAEHFPDVTLAEPCVADGAACVVGWQEPRLVAAVAGQPPQAGDPANAVEVRVDGPSATVMQAPLVCTFVPVPFALTVEVLWRDARTNP